MASDTPACTLSSLWVHSCGSPKLFRCMRWVSNFLEMNGPPSWTWLRVFSSQHERDGLYCISTVVTPALTWLHGILVPSPRFPVSHLGFDPLLISELHPANHLVRVTLFKWIASFDLICATVSVLKAALDDFLRKKNRREGEEEVGCCLTVYICARRLWIHLYAGPKTKLLIALANLKLWQSDAALYKVFFFFSVWFSDTLFIPN